MNILGNQKNISHFAKALKTGALSHAYLICGQKGSGKKTFAEYVAKALLCNEIKSHTNDGGFAPCGKCPACVKAETGNHPDLIHVTHKKDNLISVGEVREQVTDSMAIKPYYGPYKIYIMEDADLMNVNAQNALLKTIEEPPSYGVLFLLTSNRDGLLETVLSRCIQIDMDLIPEKEIESLLLEQGLADPQKAKDAAHFSKGNVGKAMQLAKGEGIAQLVEFTSGLMKSLASADAVKINAWAKETEDLDIKEFLNLVRTWLRDVLYVKATGRQEDLYFSGEHITIKDQAEHIAYEDIDRALKVIGEAEEEMTFNVKTEAAVEVMLLDIRQYLKGACPGM